MQFSPNLFERVFKYPASAQVLPNENLATEITAYFLETSQTFRERFLKEAGVKEEHSAWTIETQVRLHAPDKEWHGKIPDLLIRSKDGTTLVAVEVKIDAGITFGGEQMQTELYQKYLSHEQESGRIREHHLVVLTRWYPGDLQIAGAKSMRFTDVANWLDTAASQAEQAPGGISLEKQFATFLRERRWALRKITSRHVQAIGPMNELTTRLWDELSAIRQRILAEPDSRWCDAERARASEARYESGYVLWVGAIALKLSPNTKAQLGYFFGDFRGSPAICPMIWFQHLEYRAKTTQFLGTVEQGSKDDYFVQLANLVMPPPSEEIDERRWDGIIVEFQSVLDALVPKESSGPPLR